MTGWGTYGLTGFTGSHYERTKRAWLVWARWSESNLATFHRIGMEPAVVVSAGVICPLCFGSTIYVRQGNKNRWMRGIATCRNCHGPVLIRKPQGDQKTRQRERELILVADRDDLARKIREQSGEL